MFNIVFYSDYRLSFLKYIIYVEAVNIVNDKSRIESNEMLHDNKILHYKILLRSWNKIIVGRMLHI